jgi:hypothetical protein
MKAQNEEESLKAQNLLFKEETLNQFNQVRILFTSNSYGNIKWMDPKLNGSLILINKVYEDLSKFT